ncbi:MAG TPA: chromate resistance protein ChrB domain-containing protein [Dehalococcoidia bacterium]|nr:chromate resistance protein ChrB domain-containing protein [Dehalococcoidia bacterium]HLE80883.1 chromate resistance protein ChrB domain-containing protein [Dehalococcoidia bacterium]
MKWVTREHVKVDRVACPWLIRHFIDPQAEFLFVPPDQVLEIARRESATSFDAQGARYEHRGGKCTFEVLVEDYKLTVLGLAELSRIVHGADVAGDENVTPESAGLKAIAEGFGLAYATDVEVLEKEFPLYDALFAWCKDRVQS